MDELSNDSFSLGDLGLDMSLLNEITPQHSQEFCEPFLTGPEVFGTSDFQVIPPSPPPETAVNSPFTPVFTPSPTSSYGSPSPSPISHELPQSPWSTSSDGSVSPMVPPSGLSRRESSASLRHRHSPSDPTIFGHTLQPPTAARHIRSHSESSTTRPVASQAMLEANQRRRRHDATHVCNECGQTFTAIFSLKRKFSVHRTAFCGSAEMSTIGHMQSHSGIRPFVCGVPGCDQAFFNQSDCKRHEKSRKRHRGLPHPLSVSS
jgi:hypothetical protein